MPLTISDHLQAATRICICSRIYISNSHHRAQPPGTDTLVLSHFPGLLFLRLTSSDTHTGGLMQNTKPPIALHHTYRVR